ncbi:MAG: hypothetical protein FWF75_09755, partial [Propionibacteriaceae bacterium]|nr:hypothetical protein [Propionibacteriaceae bacterium]
MIQSAFRDIRSLIRCLVAAGLGVTAGLWGVPTVVAACAAGHAGTAVMWAALVVLAAAVALGLLGVASSRADGVAPRLRIARAAGAAGLAASLLVVVGALTGLVSLVVGVAGVPVRALHQGMDVVAWVLALGVAPVLLAVLLTGMAGVNVWARASWRGVRALYAPLVMVMAAASAVAAVLWWATGLSGAVAWLVVRAVGLTAVSGAG